MRQLYFLFYILLIIFACNPTSRQQPEDPEQAVRKTILVVDNRGFDEMTIYVARSAQRTRLGTVSGFSTKTFTIPEDIVAGASKLTFEADPLGRAERSFSEELEVRPGEQLQLIITDL
jgi:hypothetical protein